MAFKEFGTGQGYLKAGLLGFAKSGKTYTSALLATKLWQLFKLKTPIAFFDTEAGVEYVDPMVFAATGMHCVGESSRALSDLLHVGKACEEGAAGILVVDSITHVWREVCNAYLDQVNKARDAMNKPKRQRLEFQDWAAIKERWNVWTDFYLNAKLHIIICGRAGYEWDFEEVEDSSGQVRKELRKVGTKMKVESEFGFEPSLLVEMERVQVPIPDRPNHFSITHRATVIGDRFNAMDGAVIDNPTGEWFMPHLSKLVPGAVNAVDVANKTDMGVDEVGDSQWVHERRERERLCEEIQGEMVLAWPGQTTWEKKSKVEALATCFGTKSWKTVESFDAGRLANGLLSMREYIAGNHGTEQSNREPVWKEPDIPALPQVPAEPAEGDEAVYQAAQFIKRIDAAVEAKDMAALGKIKGEVKVSSVLSHPESADRLRKRFIEALHLISE
jgi:hypothetical protein